jgi:hypothetical protein
MMSVTLILQSLLVQTTGIACSVAPVARRSQYWVRYKLDFKISEWCYLCHRVITPADVCILWRFHLPILIPPPPNSIFNSHPVIDAAFVGKWPTKKSKTTVFFYLVYLFFFRHIFPCRVLLQSHSSPLWLILTLSIIRGFLCRGRGVRGRENLFLGGVGQDKFISRQCPLVLLVTIIKTSLYDPKGATLKWDLNLH